MGATRICWVQIFFFLFMNNLVGGIESEVLVSASDINLCRNLSMIVKYYKIT